MLVRRPNRNIEKRRTEVGLAEILGPMNLFCEIFEEGEGVGVSHPLLV